MRPLARDGLVIAAIVGLAKADAATMGVIAPALKSHLHISEAELGGLASLSSGTGALCALPAGTMVDRRHRLAAVTVALVVWSLALGVAGFAEGFALLALSRVLSGGVATIARPVAVSLTGDLYHPMDRGKALAVLDTGQAIGTAICFLLGALAVRALDWRWLFWWLAVAGIGLAVFTFRTPEPVRTRPPGPSLVVVLKALVTIRTNRVVLVSDSIGNFFYAGAASFAVLYITARYHLSTATVDALAPAVGVGVIGGILAGGRIGDRLTRRHGGSRRLVVAAVCQLGATAVFALAIPQGSVAAAGLLLFAGATVLGGAGPCLDAVRLDIVPPWIRGRAEAARGLLMLGSSALGPLTFGLVATAFGGRGDGLALRDAFSVMLLPLGAGALVLLAAVQPYQADAMAAGTVAGTVSGAGMLDR